MTRLSHTWTLDDGDDLEGRDLEGALVRRERTRLTCDGVAFEFVVTVDERTGAGLVAQYRLEARELTPAGDPIVAGLVVRPVIPAASVDRLGPWERTALRQAARKVLLGAAAQLRARG